MESFTDLYFRVRLVFFLPVKMEYNQSKMDYDSNLWLGCITGLVIQKCTELAISRCPGCKAKLKSPLLHAHEWQSLLEKIHTYFNEVRGSILPIVGQIYDSLKHRLPSSCDEKDRENYIAHARFFFQTANAEIIYYARYLTNENDKIINELLTQKPSRKRKNATGNTETKKPVKKDKKSTLQTPPPMNLEELLGQTYRESVMDDFNNQYV